MQRHELFSLIAMYLAILLACPLPDAPAAERGPALVPPTLEIEVLDPGVDPLGNPAVELLHAPDGQLQVDIPPVVLVHRYYYSGDRSFQAQMLPGGPSILVVNHPKSGERCYIPVQMMPGAPRVTYTSNCIEYDYGEHGMAVHFGLWGEPTVKYRSGRRWSDRLERAVHAEQWKAGTQRIAAGVKHVAVAGHDSLKEVIIDTQTMVEEAMLPVANLVRALPLGAAVFDPNRPLIRKEKIARHRREKEVEHARQEALLAEQTYQSIP